MIKQKTNFKKIIAYAASILSLLTGNLYAEPVSGSLDTRTTDKALTTDSKLSIDIDKNVNIFARNRTTFNYNEGKNSPFSLLDLSYNWSNGLGIFSETQFNGTQNPDQRFGLQYFKGLGNFSLYAEGTAGDKTKLNGETLIKGRYAKPITTNLNAIAQIETVTDFDKTGITFATQRNKLGIGIKNLEFGLETDLTQIPQNGKINASHATGGYVAYKF